MAVVFNKFILILAIFMVPQVSHGEYDLTGISRSVFNFSQQQHVIAKQNLENAINNCDGKRKLIPSSLIIPLGMSMDEIKVALFVLNSRAENICESGTREKLFYTSGIHRVVSKHYGVSSGDAMDYTEELMLSQHWKKLEFEVKYLSLNENIRKKLEAIEELKSPFLIFKTIDEIKAAN